MINIINENEYDIDEKEIQEYIKFLNEQLNNKDEYSLVFVDDEKILELNSSFRQKDSVTDVLTFIEDIDGYLGDVIICYSKIKEQADDYGHSEKRELLFLITHGFLHLLGYDHITQEEEKEMFSKQDELLLTYGIGR